MNTQDIMQLSLTLSGFNEVPADSQIYNPGDDVHRILFCIYIRQEDLNYAKQHNFDLVISHHPPDRILGDGFVKVLDRHRELMEQAGVDPVTAQEASDENKAFWQTYAEKADKGKTLDTISSTARELGIALMNIHLPCDEIGRNILQKKADQLGSDARVSSLIKAYSTIPEIKASDEKVRMICGQSESRLGKAVIIHAAGANGGYPVANALFDSGVDTVVYIHLFFQEEKERLKKENKGNLIVTGHYGSDSIGINPLIDELENCGMEVACRNNLLRKNLPLI